MPATRISFKIGGKFRNPPKLTCVSTSAGSPWAGFLTEKHRYTAFPPYSEAFACTKPHLLVVTRGKTTARWAARGERHTSYWKPGITVLLDGGYELHELEYDAPKELLLVELEPKQTGLLQDDPFIMPAIPHIIGEDELLASFAQTMYDEILGGCPNSRIFAESTSLALLTYIVRRYGISKTSSNGGKGLSAAKVRLLTEYIEVNLSEDMSLNSLAALVDLTPRYLCSGFKEAVGLSPYQFILRARIDKAKTLLKANRLPLSQVALSVGFANQSHFSHAFRKQTGMSPRTFRMQ